MQNIQKFTLFRGKGLVLFASVLGLLLLGGIAASSSTANAFPALDTLLAKKYCKDQMPDKLEDKVCTSANLDRIRTAGEAECKDEKTKKAKESCEDKYFQTTIKKVAAKKPKNENDFNQALNSLLPNSGNAGGGGACTGPTCPATPTGQGKNCDNNHCDLIGLYVNPAIKLLSIVVGLVVAASLVFAGIQYTASSGDPQKTSAAKTRITNTLLAFLAYAFMFAFLNFLVPGGLFN